MQVIHVVGHLKVLQTVLPSAMSQLICVKVYAVTGAVELENKTYSSFCRPHKEFLLSADLCVE